MKINNIIRKPVKEIGIPFVYFKRSQEVAFHNRNILYALNGNLGASMKAQKGIPIYFGSEFREITGITKLFIHREYKHTIVNIIQKRMRYHLSSIQ